VCFSWDGKRLAFASGLKGILALPGFAAQIDSLQLASVLTIFVDPEAGDATFYKGIKKLLPGCLLLASNGRIDIRRWWQPELLEPRHYQCVEDCYEEFVALYDEVVGECLRVGQGSVAATLSGGLDSGSVLALAAPRLLQRGQSMTAFVHVPLYEPTLAGSSRTGDELALATRTAQKVGNTQVVPVTSEDKTLLWGMQQALNTHLMPMHAAANFYWMFDIQQKARDMGASVLLTGQLGNASVSYGGDGNLWPVLRQGRVLSVAQALLTEETGLWLALKRRLVKPVVWPALSTWRLWRADSPQPWAAYSYIQPDWATRIQLRQRMLGSSVDLPFRRVADPQGLTVRLFRLGLLAGDFAGTTWMESGAMHGLDVRDPTRDRRIVEFCWRAPDDAFWAKGRMRGLIRQGMKDRLPDSVLNCRAKGLQAADALGRFKNESEEMLALLADAETRGLDQWMDVARMRRDLHALSSGQSMDIMSLQGLGRAVQAVLFLSKDRYTDLATI
jgi:asparagine synthase (glutamine-hydrolysing)